MIRDVGVLECCAAVSLLDWRSAIGGRLGASAANRQGSSLTVYSHGGGLAPVRCWQ